MDPNLLQTPENGVPAKPAENADTTDPVAKIINDALEKHTKALDERLGRLETNQTTLATDIVRVRKAAAKTPAPEPEAGKQAAESNAVEAPRRTPEQITALSMDLADALDGLPAEVRKQIRTRLDDGEDLETVIMRAESIREGMGLTAENAPKPSKDEENRPTLPGSAANAAHQKSAPRFETRKQWTEWKTENGTTKALEYMRTHENFDPNKLPGSPLHPGG